MTAATQCKWINREQSMDEENDRWIDVLVNIMIYRLINVFINLREIDHLVTVMINYSKNIILIILHLLHTTWAAIINVLS